MTKSEFKGIAVLESFEGKYLTNGETYSTKVYLGKNASESDWWEVDSIPIEEDDPELTAEETLAELMEVLA